jgi:hypothetical protein
VRAAVAVAAVAAAAVVAAALIEFLGYCLGLVEVIGHSAAVKQNQIKISQAYSYCKTIFRVS